MTTERELQFNVARGKGFQGDWPTVAVAQVQPHPKGLDRTKRVCASRILPDTANDSCSTRTSSVGKGFVKPKLPHIFTELVVFSGQTTVLISSTLHCLDSSLMMRCREWRRVYATEGSGAARNRWTCAVSNIRPRIPRSAFKNFCATSTALFPLAGPDGEVFAIAN